MIIILNRHAQNFGIPQAQARFLFTSLNLKLKRIINSNQFYDKGRYINLIENEDFWGNVICKKLYENLDLVTEHYSILLSLPQDYQYIIYFINFLQEMSYSNNISPEIYYDFILKCRKNDSEIEMKRLADSILTILTRTI